MSEEIMHEIIYKTRAQYRDSLKKKTNFFIFVELIKMEKNLLTFSLKVIETTDILTVISWQN